MTDGTEDDEETIRGFNDLKPYSAVEALSRTPAALEVADDEDLELSPAKRGHEKYFARVRLERLEDLQVLGLVPRRLKMQTIREAISADDEQARNIGEQRMRQGEARAKAPCGCHGAEAATSASPCGCHGTSRTATSFSQDLRSMVQHVRHDYHPELARVLTNHYGIDFRWDSALAVSIHGWVRRFRPDIHVIVNMFEDITVGRNARLVLKAQSTSLLARAIQIHRTGTLVHRGGYLRIWANSIDRFDGFPGVISWKNIIWALEL